MSYIERIASKYEEQSLSQEELAYYARHLLLPGIGTRGQLKLKCARVLVVGAGGLGCPVLQALAGAGVGHLTVIDWDVVALSNLSRQWLHKYDEVGLNKAGSARTSLSMLNPFIVVEAVAEMLDEKNAKRLIEEHDLVVDATDDLEVRYLIDEACAEKDKPWVHAALYRERSQLCVFWAKYGARFSQLFPETSEAPSCAGAGMMGATASVIANLQALEVIKLITASAAPKVGELISFDAEAVALQSFRMPGVETASPFSEEIDTSRKAIEADALKQALSVHESLALIDLRSETEFAEGSAEGAVHRTAESILEAGLPAEFESAKRIVLLCAEGAISSLLTDALRAKGLSNVSYLKGGFAEFL